MPSFTIQHLVLCLVLRIITNVHSAEDISIVDFMTDLHKDGLEDLCASGYDEPYELDGLDPFVEKTFDSLLAAVDTAQVELLKFDGNFKLPADQQRARELSNSATEGFQSRPDVKSVEVLFGLDDESNFCFKNTKVVFCNKERNNFFSSTVYSSWKYVNSCKGWTGVYSSVGTEPKEDGQGIVGFKKVVITVEVVLDNLSINQCDNSSDNLFSGSHLCDRTVSQCIFKPDGGFRIGSYLCQCTSCSSCQDTDGAGLYRIAGNVTDVYGFLRRRCTSVDAQTDGRCSMHVEELSFLPYILLGVNGFGIFACCMIAVIILVQRSAKAVQSAKCIILVLILVGAIIIYSSLLLKYLNPEFTTCILQPWTREIGFVFVYGAVVLKTYKVLAEFQTRKARRVHVRDKDLLKYWLGCFVLTCGYVAAWTAVTINYVYWQKLNLVVTGCKPYTMCLITGWNYVTQFGELVFIGIGLYMSYRLRSASSPFWESKFFAAALTIELVVSLAYYILSNILSTHLSSLWMMTMTFIHQHLTISVVLILVFGPKLYYIKHPPSDGAFLSKDGNTTDHVDFRTHNKDYNNGDVDIDEINLTEMNPEEIRKEMRRVYTQLQALKVKVMRYENPHIHGKRSRSGNKKAPFYKQLTKQGFHHKRSNRDRDSADVEPTIDSIVPETEPLNQSDNDGTCYS